MAWSPDGRWIAIAGYDAAIGIWDADSGELEFSASGHTAPVNRLDWSPDSHASGDGELMTAWR